MMVGVDISLLTLNTCQICSCVHSVAKSLVSKDLIKKNYNVNLHLKAPRGSCRAVWMCDAAEGGKHCAVNNTKNTISFIQTYSVGTAFLCRLCNFRHRYGFKLRWNSLNVACAAPHSLAVISLPGVAVYDGTSNKTSPTRCH